VRKVEDGLVAITRTVEEQVPYDELRAQRATLVAQQEQEAALFAESTAIRDALIAELDEALSTEHDEV
jgi:ribosomal 50S subunit-associated protein YjgA (DUF615 family)